MITIILRNKSALLFLSLFCTNALANDFKSCVVDYKVFVDRELNAVPKPKGTERAKVAMIGFNKIQNDFPNLSFDELVECARKATELSNKNISKNSSKQTN